MDDIEVDGPLLEISAEEHLAEIVRERNVLRRQLEFVERRADHPITVGGRPWRDVFEETREPDPGTE
jgi:hypothetical protein